MIRVKVGGAPLDRLGPFGGVKWSTCYGTDGGGVLTVSWNMYLPRGFAHPAVRNNALVELYDGALRLGAAVLSEPDREGWSFTADGLYRQGERFRAVDALGAPSTDLSVIIPAAINRGLRWRNPGGLPAGALSTDSETQDRSNSVAAVLTAYCQNNNKRWLVDANDYVRIVDDPTDPTWSLTPGVPAMATADDDYVTRTFGRYVSAVSGTPPEPSAWGTAIYPPLGTALPEESRYGVSEMGEDLTDLGTLTSTAASDLIKARMTTERVRPAFTQGVEVSRLQITRGSVPARLPWVVAGQRVTHHGVRDLDGRTGIGNSTSWVIGGTEHEAGSDRITLTPVGLAARTTSAVIAAQQKAAQASTEAFS